MNQDNADIRIKAEKRQTNLLKNKIANLEEQVEKLTQANNLHAQRFGELIVAHNRLGTVTQAQSLLCEALIKTVSEVLHKRNVISSADWQDTYERNFENVQKDQSNLEMDESPKMTEEQEQPSSIIIP